MVTDIPLLLLTVTVCIYWGTVALLAVYQRLRHGRRSGLLPRRGYEWRLWALIVPAVVSWVMMPFLAANNSLPGVHVPLWAYQTPGIGAVRWAAAGCAVAGYFLSLYSWLLLGRNWSMAVVPGQASQLVTSGIYGWVRHPIYSLQIGIMLLSVVVIPTAPMALLACLHWTAMNRKAHYEERYLAKSFGPAYGEYCRQVGRFWPRWPRRTRNHDVSDGDKAAA